MLHLSLQTLVLKILIITAWYAPFIHPRAHRWTALAAHWAAEGHTVEVVTARLRGCAKESIQEGVRVHRVGFDSLKEVVYYYFSGRRARGRVGVPPTKPGVFARISAWIYRVFWKNIFFPDDACVWYWPARRKVLSMLRQEQPDLLISVSLPFTGHLLGLAAKCRFPELRWLADIGDPFAFRIPPPNNTLFYSRKNFRLERQVLETADVLSVTTLATLHKYREIFGDAAIRNMQVIPPLLHYNIAEPAKIAANPDAQTIRIGYFGALYSPTRTPDAFLHLLEQTFDLQPTWQQRLEVHFYGEIFPEFYDQLTRFPVMRLHGLRPREEVRKAMQDMDILLNIGNATDFQLPSKAVDYLASGKPVLNLRYTENDPFADLFGDNELIINIQVENNRVARKEVLRWLDMPKKVPGKEELEKRVAPYKTEVIAKTYLGMMNDSSFIIHNSSFISSPHETPASTAAAPGHC